MAAKPDPFLAQAKALVDALLDPPKANLEAQRQQELAEAEARQQGIQGFSQAAAQQVAPIGAQVQSGYQSAAGNTANAAQGFSTGFLAAMKASEADLNAYMAKQGSPQTVNHNAQAATDALFGTSGFIPAAGLEREGAAFGAAASFLPATMLGQGQQLAAQERERSRKKDKGYFDKLAEIEAARPGEVQKALLELKNLAVKERAQNLSDQIAIQKLGIDKAKLGLESDRIKISAANAQTSRYNAQLRKLQNDRSWQATIKRLGLQEAGLGLRATELEAKLKAPKNKKAGGFTAKQLRDLQQQAYDTARDDFEGYDPATDTSDKKNQRRPIETLRDLIAAGVPFSVAIKAINRFWPHTRSWAKPPRPKQGN